MASSGSDANLSAALYAPGCSRDVDHAPTRLPFVAIAAPAVGFGRDLERMICVDLVPNPRRQPRRLGLFDLLPRGVFVPSPPWACKLARPQQFFNHLRMLTATSR